MEEKLILDDEFTNQQNQYAGFWIRVGAALLDMLVMSPFIGLTFYNLYGSLKSLPVAIICAIIPTIYKIYMEGTYGYTLGKKWLGISIVDSANEKIDMRTAIVRAWPWIVALVINALATIHLFGLEGFDDVHGFMEMGMFQQQNKGLYDTLNMVFSVIFLVVVVVVAFDTKKQGLHDKSAGSFCVLNKSSNLV